MCLRLPLQQQEQRHNHRESSSLLSCTYIATVDAIRRTVTGIQIKLYRMAGREPSGRSKTMSAMKKRISLTLGRSKTREHSYTGISDDAGTYIRVQHRYSNALEVRGDHGVSLSDQPLPSFFLQQLVSLSMQGQSYKFVCLLVTGASEIVSFK